jgi:HEPN domain-containing protein
MKQTGDRPFPGSPEDWFAHAESDLNIARLVKDREEVLPSQICFHAQQAAEKALKAVLVSRETEFPRTHVIQALIQLAQQSGLIVPPEVVRAGLLTPYAVVTRYPGYAREITARDVDEAVDLAGRVIAWAREVTAGKGASP